MIVGIFGNLKAPFQRRASARPRTRDRLIEMLCAAGYPVDYVTGAKGYYRIKCRQNLDDTTVCWETHLSRRTEEHVQGTHVVSYDTMTDCVRRGFEVLNDDGILWVCANKKQSEAVTS